MPVTPTYPGVYIEEVPSGVRTIVGVATSITAFIGRAARGPVDDPVTINNFGDFERIFGGLGLDYPMSYPLRDFFLNGGTQAIVVRLYNAPNQGGAETAQIDTNGLTLEAASRGSWANTLRARVDHDVPAPANPGDPHPLPWVDTFGLTSADLFNLTVRDTATGGKETFFNLTVAESPRRVDRVLEKESSFVRVSGSLPGSIPTADNDITDPADPVWTDDNFSSPVSTDGEDSTGLDQGAYEGSQANKTGLYALEDADLFNLLCIPPDTRGGDVPSAVWSTALSYCQQRRAMLIVDPRSGWNSAANARDNLDTDIGLTGLVARNAALYFPRVRQADSLLDGQIDTFVPCGIVAGVLARTDATRGVWKAPAGTEAALRGTQGLAVKMTNDENGMLNPLGINSLRSFPIIGRVVWGTRTLRGADQLADEYKYIPVRRLALFIEESLFRGTQWVVFEPNDEPLWSQIRLNVGAFMQNLFRQGAFQGSSPRDAYFVKVDSETTTQNDINLGIVNIVVGFAPLKPAEFVIIKIQQIAGQIES
ncbi:MAG: phage tail sheath subtilisin-like domain-containing protein [Pseudomonadota bacterium]|nr:phage tail sheath subtilisin-like domain-containing protein [Pseudomonadota bacterium]